MLKRPQVKATPAAPCTDSLQQLPRLYTVAEAAEFLRITPGAARQMICRGQLRVLHIGRRVRVRQEDLLALVDSAPPTSK